MKTIKYRLFLIVGLFGLATLSCEENQDVITEDAQEGAFVSLTNSSGSLAGSPVDSDNPSESQFTFTDVGLTYNAAVTSPNIDQVDRLVVVKQFNGQEVEITSVDAREGIEVTFESVEDFLDGFADITEEELRLGDNITFRTYIHMRDGRVLEDLSTTLGVSVACAADLTGTYSVTNSVCNNGPYTVTVTRNADGSYFLTMADGGFLSKCTSNSTLLNGGTIQEQCGEILPSSDLDYGADNSQYDIGHITGGTWDASTGTISLNHTQGLFTGSPGEYTSTYVRQ
jgi:hypothetical protein